MPLTKHDATIAPSRKLQSTQMKGIDFGRNTWSIELSTDGQFEDVLSPDFWSHVRTRLTPGDFVVVTTVDHRFIARGYVLGINPVVVVDMEEPRYLGRRLPVPEAFSVRWNVGKKWFEVVRAKDKYLMQGGFGTHDQAAAWLEEHLQKVAA